MAAPSLEFLPWLLHSEHLLHDFTADTPGTIHTGSAQLLRKRQSIILVPEQAGDVNAGKGLNPKAVPLLGAVTGPPGGSVGWGSLWQGTCWPGLLPLTWEWDGAQSGAPRLF